MNSTPFTAPRPTPTFFTETSFSTKRERSQTPRDKPPPPLKPISRKTLFSGRDSSIKKENRASIISNKSPRKTLANYDPNIQELYFDQVFDIICKIGSGSFGEVYKVRCKSDNQYYAVKKSKERFKSGIDRLNKLQEANRYEELPYHRNCVKFIKAWEERDQLYIQTELCKMSLSDYADKHHNIPDKQVWNYLIDLLMAVKHMHDHNLIHLDIKPDNVFVKEDDVCKLGDFGLVFNLNKGTESAVEGDAKYLAPEILSGNFGKAADIFSLGISILELACDLDLPKGDELWHQLRNNVLPEDLLKEKPEELQFCIRSMMHPCPSERPSVDQILNHPFVYETWQRRLQEQIELENKAKSKASESTSPIRKTKSKLWSSDLMHSIAERSMREEGMHEEKEGGTPVISSNFSPPLISHPFLDKEISLTSPSLSDVACNTPNTFDISDNNLDHRGSKYDLNSSNNNTSVNLDGSFEGRGHNGSFDSDKLSAVKSNNLFGSNHVNNNKNLFGEDNYNYSIKNKKNNFNSSLLTSNLFGDDDDMKGDNFDKSIVTNDLFKDPDDKDSIHSDSDSYINDDLFGGLKNGVRSKNLITRSVMKSNTHLWTDDPANIKIHFDASGCNGRLNGNSNKRSKSNNNFVKRNRKCIKNNLKFNALHTNNVNNNNSNFLSDDNNEDITDT